MDIARNLIDEDLRLQTTGYLYHTPPLHPRRQVDHSCERYWPNLINLFRTLDQSSYHMLSSTSWRDRDQVVTRRAEKENLKSHNMLMVDQLWMWIIKGRDDESDTVISSFPSRQGVRGRNHGFFFDDI